jgi:hypothetical protein
MCVPPTNQHTAGEGNDPLGKNARQCREKLRHCLRTFCQLASPETHAQTAGSIGNGDVGTADGCLLMPQECEHVSTGVEHGHAERLESAFRAFAQGRRGNDESLIECQHDERPGVGSEGMGNHAEHFLSCFGLVHIGALAQLAVAKRFGFFDDVAAALVAAIAIRLESLLGSRGLG